MLWKFTDGFSYFFFCNAWHSLQPQDPIAPRPKRMNTTVYHWMFQKFQTFRFCNKNRMPNIKNSTPHIFVHFSHIIVHLAWLLVSFCTHHYLKVIFYRASAHGSFQKVVFAIIT